MRLRPATETIAQLSLTDLPKELRDKIYRYVVVFGIPLRPNRLVGYDCWQHTIPNVWHDKSPIECPIFRLNKQIYAEALDIFLKENQFHFTWETFQAEDYLRPLAGRIRNLTIDVDEPKGLPWTARFLAQNAPFNNLTIRIVIQATVAMVNNGFLVPKHRLPDQTTLNILRSVKVRKAAKFHVASLEYSVDFLFDGAMRILKAEEARLGEIMVIFASIEKDMLSHRQREIAEDMAKRARKSQIS